MARSDTPTTTSEPAASSSAMQMCRSCGCHHFGETVCPICGYKRPRPGVPAQILAAAALMVAGCGADRTATGGEETSETAGDGDGDGSGDGDGDGDGSGDGDGDGTGDGDGDGDGAGDGDGDGDGGTFYGVPSDGPVVQTCDIWLQDCPDGEKCVPYASIGEAWDSTKCVPVLGDNGAGDSCNYDGPQAATDDCDQASICVVVLGDDTGTCTAQCTGTPDDPMCDDGFTCLISGDGPAALCIENCDPLEQTCGDGRGCYWGNTEFFCMSTSDNHAPGDPCGFVNDCEPGATCTNADFLESCAGLSCCASFCSTDAADPCANANDSCVAWYQEGEAPLGLEDVGVCVFEAPP